MIAWLMLNKEQILRKKIRTDARCNVWVKWQLQKDYFSVTNKDWPNKRPPVCQQKQ